MSQTVSHIPLTPPLISLVNSASTIDETDERWILGLIYVPEGCGEADAFDLCDHDPTTGFTKTISASSGPVTGTPYGIVAQDTCSTFSWRSRDYEARATRKLRAMESFIMARELWDGSLVGLNPTLADALDITVGLATPESIITAFSTIEQEFFDRNNGARAMIHVRPNILMTALSLGSMGIHREGNVYYTAMDSVVVADRGYPGTGPAGQAASNASEWMYASPLVVIRRGPISTIPNNLSEAVFRTTNQVTFYAERAVQATWDYNCDVLALNVKRDS